MGDITNERICKIVTSDGSFSYQVTEEDLVWMARSIVCESKADRAYIAWCYAQRFVMMRGTFSTLTGMIRAFSQPVNPAWMAGGTYCGPGGRYASSEQYCGPSHLAARVRCSSTPWSSIAPEVRSYLLSWAACEEPNVAPKVVDFRARDSLAQAIIDGTSTSKPTLEYVALPSRNAFFTDTASRRWPRDYVRLQVGSRSIGERTPSAWGYALAVLGVAGAMGATAFLERHRR